MFRHFFTLAATVSRSPARPHWRPTRKSSSTRRRQDHAGALSEAAPKTVENFLAYVKGKQYDGTQFIG